MSHAHLAGEVLKILADHVEGIFRAGFSGVGASFSGSSNMAGAQADGCGCLEVAAVRGDHHAFAGFEVERLRRGEIDARLRLEVLGDLRAQNRMPAQVVASPDVRHQGDVAIRARAQHVPGAQPRETPTDVLPGIEAMPREGQFRLRCFIDLVEAERGLIRSSMRPWLTSSLANGSRPS